MVTLRRTLYLIVLSSMLLAPAMAQRRGDTKAPGRGEELLPATREAAGVKISLKALAKGKKPGIRSRVVASLLADDVSKAILDKVAQTAGGEASTLPTISLSGLDIPPNAAGSDLTMKTYPSLDELDWDAGVHFSPWGSPRIKVDGETEPVGVTQLGGMCSYFGYSLGEMYDDGVVVLESHGGSIGLYGRLPDEVGTYVIVIGLTPFGCSDLVAWWENHNVADTLATRLIHGGNTITLPLVPQADGSGFAAVATLHAAAEEIPGSSIEMRELDWALYMDGSPEIGFAEDMLFSGVTIIRL